MGLFNELGDQRMPIIIATAIFLFLAWVTVSLRIWVRCVMIRSVGWDDAALIFTTFLFTGFCALVVTAILGKNGAGHINDLSYEQLEELVGLVIASLELYIATMIFFKISLATFYLRIVIRSWQRYLVIGAVTINTLYGSFTFFMALFNCGNPSKYLTHELTGMCLPQSTLYAIQLSGCLINAVTDWIFAILPIFVLVKATMPLIAKLSAGFILLLACCGSIVSLVRISFIKGLTPGPDFFNTVIDLAIWSIVECGLGISAAAAATLRPLFRDWMETGRISFPQGSNRRSTYNAGTQFSDPRGSKSGTRSSTMHENQDVENLGYLRRISRWSIPPLLRGSISRSEPLEMCFDLQERRPSLPKKLVTQSEEEVFGGPSPISPEMPQPEIPQLDTPITTGVNHNDLAS